MTDAQISHIGRVRQFDSTAHFPLVTAPYLGRWLKTVPRPKLERAVGMKEIKSDERLLQALRNAARQKQTPEESHRQRVSYIIGVLGRRSGITKEKIEQVLARRDG